MAEIQKRENGYFENTDNAEFFLIFFYFFFVYSKLRYIFAPHLNRKNK